MRALTLVVAGACCAGSLAGAAGGGTCPDAQPTADATGWDCDRAWIHEAGWLEPLDSAAAVAAKGQEYPSEAPMLVVRAGGETRAYPVETMACHHVANDIIGGQPVVTTY